MAYCLNVKKIMGKPSIGTVVTSEEMQKRSEQIKKLTEVEKDSKESIYQLVFAKGTKDGVEINE